MASDSSLENYLKSWKFKPNKLYRFRNLSIPIVQEIIDGKIFLADPRDFNDPFDSSYSFSERIMRSRERLISYTYKLTKLEYKRSSTVITPILYSKKNYDEEQEKLLEFINKTINIGIACFSENIESTVMWSHYSKNHEGICLEYDTNDFSHDEWPIYKVKYSREALNCFKLGSDDGLLPLLINKSTEWCYEKEWRIIKPLDSNNRFLNFSKPKSIIMGYRIPNQYVEMLIKFAIENELMLKLAVPDKENFRMNIVNIPNI